MTPTLRRPFGNWTRGSGLVLLFLLKPVNGMLRRDWIPTGMGLSTILVVLPLRVILLGIPAAYTTGKFPTLQALRGLIGIFLVSTAAMHWLLIQVNPAITRFAYLASPITLILVVPPARTLPVDAAPPPIGRLTTRQATRPTTMEAPLTLASSSSAPRVAEGFPMEVPRSPLTIRSITDFLTSTTVTSVG